MTTRARFRNRLPHTSDIWFLSISDDSSSDPTVANYYKGKELSTVRAQGKFLVVLRPPNHAAGVTLPHSQVTYQGVEPSSIAPPWSFVTPTARAAVFTSSGLRAVLGPDRGYDNSWYRTFYSAWRLVTPYSPSHDGMLYLLIPAGYSWLSAAVSSTQAFDWVGRLPTFKPGSFPITLQLPGVDYTEGGYPAVAPALLCWLWDHGVYVAIAAVGMSFTRQVVDHGGGIRQITSVRGMAYTGLNTDLTGFRWQNKQQFTLADLPVGGAFGTP